jgi:hypothetical protein
MCDFKSNLIVTSSLLYKLRFDEQLKKICLVTLIIVYYPFGGNLLSIDKKSQTDFYANILKCCLIFEIKQFTRGNMPYATHSIYASTRDENLLYLHDDYRLEKLAADPSHPYGCESESN